MKREKIYLIDNSGNGFRCGVPAEIIGVEMITPEGLKPRLCYHLRWSDSVEDFKPIKEDTYTIITFTDLINRNNE